MTKPKRPTQHVPRATEDIVAANMVRLKELFPESVTEGKLDIAKLRASLGDEVDDRPERYSFMWAGKRDAIRALQSPAQGSLAPRPKESLHFDETSNVFIEGDNLEVLKLLYKSYAGRVKMIYIDPPYNTGNDFVYPDNYADPLDTYLRITGQKGENGDLLTSNPETNGRYHSSWLSMMYPRLFLARQLLREDGLIFITTDDAEAANLRLVMNEIFGEENFVACIAWEKRFTRSNNAKLFASVKDTILLYRKSADVDTLRESRTEKANAIYSNPDHDPRGPWTSVSYVNPATKAQRPNLVYPIRNPFTGKDVTHPTNAWKFEPAQHRKHVAEKSLWWGKDGGYQYPRLKKFLSEVSDGLVPVDIWPHKETGTTDEGSKELEALLGHRVFDNPKPSRLIRRMLALGTAPEDGDVVLDFFAGSCTTADAVVRLNREDGGNRRFVMIQLPEPTPKDSAARKAGYATIAEIGKERIRRVAKELASEKQGKLKLAEGAAPEDLGFRVFALAPSKYRPWQEPAARTGEAYAQTLEMFKDPLVSGWKPPQVIWEVAIKEGFGLTARVGKLQTPKDREFFRVTDEDRKQSFIITLEDKVRLGDVRSLKLGRDDLFICRDVALDDEAAANLALQCRLETI